MWVVFMARTFTTAVVMFKNEPAPAQIRELERLLHDFEEAIWQTMSGGGDVDTNCAMVGGIVACFVGREGLPVQWLAQREDLPQWVFED